jgi:hypothetical protein
LRRVKAQGETMMIALQQHIEKFALTITYIKTMAMIDRMIMTQRRKKWWKGWRRKG